MKAVVEFYKAGRLVKRGKAPVRQVDVGHYEIKYGDAVLPKKRGTYWVRAEMLFPDGVTRAFSHAEMRVV